MSPRHSDQMSQKSQVSRIALWWSSLNAFVFVIVVVFVFVFVIVFVIVFPILKVSSQVNVLAYHFLQHLAKLRNHISIEVFSKAVNWSQN